MKKIIWNVEYLGLPLVVKHCPKCGGKARFYCSEKFRVNAHKKELDIWLIYKCCGCDATWNARVYSQIPPQTIKLGRLEKFYNNDAELVKEYAMDLGFLYKNGAEKAELPWYTISGENFLPDEKVRLIIKNSFALPVKAASVIKRKLQLTQAEYLQMLDSGKIKSVPQQDLRKYRLKDEVIIVFNCGVC